MAKLFRSLWEAMPPEAQVAAEQKSQAMLAALPFQELQSRDDRARLDTAVTALSLFIHDLCPEARLEVSFVRYEDEDAHIWVTFPPTLSEAEREDLANRIAEPSLEVLLTAGVLILAGVEES